MDNKKIVTLQQFSSSAEANIYRALLEDAGITALLTGEYTNEIYPLGESWAGIQMKVAAEDAARAKEILAAGFDMKEFDEESEKE